MSIRLAEANRAIQAALAKAHNLAVNISVTVCDADGRLVAFQRIDGTLAEAHRASYGKALVSATSGRPSGDESIEFYIWQRQSRRPHLQGAGRRVGVAVRACFSSLSFALALGPRYLPTTRLTTMAAMPASTALAIGDDRMSVIGLADACC